MKKTIAFLALIISNLAIAQFTTQQGGHCYTLDVPDYLTKTFQLNDVATLQYLNASKESYIIVIEDSKYHLNELGMKFVDAEDFLTSFIADYQLESPNREVGESRLFKSNGYNHAQLEMTWGGDSDIYMLITTVETQGYFYKILCWTLLEYKDQFKQDYMKIAASLKE